MKKSSKILLWIFSVLAFILITAIITLVIILEPSIKIKGFAVLDESKFHLNNQSITILDKYDNEITTFSGSNNATITIDEVPEHTLNAFIAIEDKRFYKHKGIDYKRIGSAMWQNIKSFSFKEGGSTITQQLIKNTHLTQDKTLKRKVNEIRLAREMERKYSKKQILQEYLNVIYFGSGIYGIGSAAQAMFEKSVSNLTLSESAALAAIINNPSKYSPYNHYDELILRRNLVLRLMKEQNLIDDKSYASAVSETLTFKKNKFTNQFVENLIKQAAQLMHCSEKLLYRSSVTIKTNYDPDIKGSVSKILNGFYANTPDYKNCNMRVLIIDNKTHTVICDESTTSTSMLNVKRSPASTIKPFFSYATALESGKYYTMSQLNDTPTTFDDYTPKNYKNSYSGYISLQEALYKSKNVPAVLLADDLGVDNCKQTAQRFGFEFSENDKSLSLALGGMHRGVTLNSIADAYSTLANSGTHYANSYITEIKVSDKVVYRMRHMGTKAVNDDTAYLLTDILKKCASIGTASKLSNYPNFAAKTGTNGQDDGNLDAYCAAYSPNYTIVAWAGNKNELMNNSVTGAYMSRLIAQILDSGVIKDSSDFIIPRSVVRYDINLKWLQENREVVLADTFLQPRYRASALFSASHVPINRRISIIDYYDEYFDSLYPLDNEYA